MKNVTKRSLREKIEIRQKMLLCKEIKTNVSLILGHLDAPMLRHQLREDVTHGLHQRVCDVLEEPVLWRSGG